MKILPKVYETLGNATYKVTDPHVFCPFGFYLVNANGVPEKTVVQTLKIDYLPVDDWQGKGTYNKDQMMDFVNFLASKPGTEIEVVCNCLGMKSGPNDCTEIIKNARGLQCVMRDTDRQFESNFGTIVE